MSKLKTPPDSLSGFPIKPRAFKDISEIGMNYAPNRERRHWQHYNDHSVRHIIEDRSAEHIHTTDNVLKAFQIQLGQVSYDPNNPNPILKAKKGPLDAIEILYCLAKLDQIKFSLADSFNRRRFDRAQDLVVQLLALRRSQSKDVQKFDKDCVGFVCKLNLSGISIPRTSNALVTFFQQCNAPRQAERLAKWGANTHNEVRNSIRIALKAMGRKDLLPLMGTGGPEIAHLSELMPDLAIPAPEI